MSETNKNPQRMVDQAIAHETRPPAQVMDDEALITLFQSGDEGAFRQLVEKYAQRVRNLVYSIFNDPSMVDDIAQEVFIRVYEGLPKFRFESSFYTWLYRIAVNKSRDEMRKRKAKRFLSLHALLENSNQELQTKLRVHQEDNDAKELVSKALQRLPEKFRVPIILKDIDGLSYEEMAEVMQCEIGTVKSRLSRARGMMRRILTPLLAER
ncbi:MAG TPA: sigma-70 family RNA polymerase sigma factor [Bacteroidota bacterium]|nr:sigma-70 family RNA polymerase sigma factor [Bacteroidota bacterium]